MQSEKAFLPSGGFDESRLREPGDAIAHYLQNVSMPTIGRELIALTAAYGRVLADDIATDRDYPDAPRSAMDGFALRAGRDSYRLAGAVHMGSALDAPVADGDAVRIPTGGVVPEGCDAVVAIEDARVEQGRIVVSEPAAPGDNVIPRASDMRAGEPILPAGRRLRSADIAVLATLGYAAVPVRRRPRVAVLSSGDELIAVDEMPQPGQIRDSNRHAVGSTLGAWGCDVRHHATVGDEPGALEGALRGLLGTCDAIVLTGGSSVGERDATPRAIAALGDPGVIVHGIAVKPGKPTVLAAIDSTPIVGLPGNPSSALMILQAVAKPIFEALTGGALETSLIEARLGSAVSSRCGWTWYIPMRVEDEAGRAMAHPLPLRSSAVSLIARATGYAIMGPDTQTWNTAEVIQVHRFV